MVKVCPNCETKNFDDARFCIKCAEHLRGVVPQRDESQESILTPQLREFDGLQPRGYTPQPWQGRFYSKLGLIFAALFCVFLFMYPLLILLFILSISIIILGKIGVSNGDTFTGKFVFIIGIILFVVTLIFLIIALVVRF